MTNSTLTNERKKMYFSVEAQQRSRQYADDGYSRTAFTSSLVSAFIQGVEVVPHEKYPQLHSARLEITTFVVVEVLKNITYEAVIRSPALQVVEHRGKKIIKDIFNAIYDKGGDRLLPKDYRDLYSEWRRAKSM